MDALRTGTIGVTYHATACWVGPYASRYAADALTYRSRARSRHGLLLDAGSHIFDLLIWALDDSLHVEGCDVECNERGVDINCTVTLRLDTQGRAWVATSDSSDHESEQRQVTFEADNGTIVLDDHGATLTIGHRYSEWIPAGECCRPVDDLLALRQGEPVLGASLHDAVRISRLLIEAYDCAGAPAVQRWRRPRFKPWGRLNGSC